MPALVPDDPPASPSPITLPTLTAVGVGTTVNDGTGDPLRTAFQTINADLALLLGALGYCAPQAWEVTTVQTADYNASVGGYLIRMDTTAGNLNVNLPSAADVEGHVIEITKWDNSANDVICVLDGSDDFYGTAGTVVTQYDVLRLRAVSDGWLKV